MCLKHEIKNKNATKIFNCLKDQNGDFMNPRIAIIAKSGSGKSWVIRDILYYIKRPIMLNLGSKQHMRHYFQHPFFAVHDYTGSDIS